MNTQLLTGEDTRFLAQQPEYEVDIMVGQMTTLMQNITDLQNDTDDRVAQLQNQNWFKRMANTLFGKNKTTKQEIQKNNDKVVTYISQSVAQLYNMNLINERVICSLGNRMNEVYMQITDQNQEMLNMKGQISQLMAVQQQTLEAMGVFVNKLNEKIESVDNFHMMISEIQNGMYHDSSKLYNLCSILSQLDKRQMNDNRKMALLKDTLLRVGIITSDEITVLGCLQEIIALPQEKIGLIYLELCNFRNSFPANLFADMIEGYHFLSKMEKMSKKKELLIQRVLDKYELEPEAAFSIEDIFESFFENKKDMLVSPDMLRIGENSNTEAPDTAAADYYKDTEDISDKTADVSGKEAAEEVDYESLSAKELIALANSGDPNAMEDLGYAYQYGEDDDAFGVSGIKQDLMEATRWFLKAADMGMMYSQYMFGMNCYTGDGIPENHQRAVKYLKKAVGQGCDPAKTHLGWCYYLGDSVPEDTDKAKNLLLDAAKHHSSLAMLRLGHIYKNEKHAAQAIQWYQKAADHGIAFANTCMGGIYRNGEGTKINHAKAYDYFKKAASAGDEDAQNYLGLMFYNGEHVQENYETAAKYFRKAAEQGLDSAQYNLGYVYYYGHGVPKDKGVAQYWMQKAAQQGYKDAAEFLREH